MENPKFVNLPVESSEGIRTQLQEHDVLISITADIGIISYVDPRVPIPAYINQHIALVRFDQAKTCGKFVSYFLASEKPQRLFRASTDTGAKAGMSLPTVQKIEVAFPPLPEQRAIAEALSDVDALLDGLERLIAKKRDLKQAAMQQLLTGQTRLPGFSGEWEFKRLGDQAELVTKGTTPSSLGKEFTNSGVTFIKIEAISANGIIIQDKLDFIDEETDKLLSRSRLKAGDLLFSIAGALGRVCIVPSCVLPANTNQALAIVRLKPNSDLNLLFTFFVLLFSEIKQHVEGISVQGAQANLSLQQVSDFPIFSPDYKEQAAIATVLSDMDAEIAALQARRDKTRALKQGMMQELLTGKTRLL
ncbi:restriction endonuclease subunit S [Methylomonas sp. CM2]|uniref:restriction endonuclease subunit S n=1 Tax=Methylomonas sp. CM2 TaxID=3417647 RepID=UPI003CFACE27